MEDAAFHAARDRDDLACEWPDSSSEASTTTWVATSSGCATFRSAIVRVMRPTCSSVSAARVIGDTVQPGATTFTRARGATRTTSFFRLSSSRCAIADFAAA